MWVAWAEMFFTIATRVSRFDLRLAVGTDQSAVANERDFFVPFPEVGKQGVWVTIEKRAAKA